MGCGRSTVNQVVVPQPEVLGPAPVGHNSPSPKHQDATPAKQETKGNHQIKHEPIPIQLQEMGPGVEDISSPAKKDSQQLQKHSKKPGSEEVTELMQSRPKQRYSTIATQKNSQKNMARTSKVLQRTSLNKPELLVIQHSSPQSQGNQKNVLSVSGVESKSPDKKQTRQLAPRLRQLIKVYADD